MKVFIINGNYQYQSMFVKAGWNITNDFFEADLIQFTGGEDVTPEIYGEVNTNSHNNFNRDLVEAGYFALATRLNKPMAGICRGGQFLNVMCGGKMIQHIEGHAIHGTHEVIDLSTNKIFKVTSTHHQMMVVSTDPDAYYDVIGVASIINEEEDVEVVHYPELNVLCFQPHPEFPGYEDCTTLYFKLLDEYLELKS